MFPNLNYVENLSRQIYANDRQSCSPHPLKSRGSALLKLWARESSGDRGGAVLGVIGVLSTVPGSYPPNSDNPECPQTLPSIPWGDMAYLLENLCSKVTSPMVSSGMGWSDLSRIQLGESLQVFKEKRVPTSPSWSPERQGRPCNPFTG